MSRTHTATDISVSWSYAVRYEPETHEQRILRECKEHRAAMESRRQWMADQRSKINYKKTSGFKAAETLKEGLVEAYLMLMRYSDPNPLQWWEWTDRPYLVGQIGHDNLSFGRVDHRRLKIKPRPDQCRSEVEEFAKDRSVFLLDGGEFREHQMRALRKIFSKFRIHQIPVPRTDKMGMFQITTHQTDSRGNMSPWYINIWQEPVIFFTYFNQHNMYQFVIMEDRKNCIGAKCWAFEELKMAEIAEAKRR